MSLENISEIVINAQNGNKDAFSKLYELTYEKAYYTALKITKDSNDAQDMIQDAYVKAFTSLDTLNEPAKFQSWFNCIVANMCRNFLVKKKPNLFSEYESDDNDFVFEDTLTNEDRTLIPHNVADNKETRKLVLECIDNLSEEQKICVIMYYYDEMSVKDIASSLNLSDGTVKSRLSLARKKLKKDFEELERKGTKLYGVSVVPLIIWALLYDSEKKKSAPISRAIKKQVFHALQRKGIATGAGLAGGGTIFGVTASQAIIGIIIAAVSVAAIIGGITAYLNSKDDEESTDPAAITQNGTEDTTDSTPDEVEIHTSYGDYAVTDDSDNLYYITNNGVVKESDENSQVIFENRPYNLTRENNNVYFVSSGKLYEYNGETTNALFDVASGYIYFLNDKIIGINSSNTKAYEIDIKNKTELPITVKGHDLRYFNAQIYYRDGEENLHRMNPVSKNEQLLVKYSGEYGIKLPYQIENGNIYYTEFNSDETGNVYYKSLKTLSEEKIVLSTGITDFSVNSGTVYYSDYNGNLYCAGTDASNAELIREGNFGYSCSPDGYQLWYNADNEKSYLIKNNTASVTLELDGCVSNAQIVNGRVFYQVGADIYDARLGVD